MKTAAKVFIIIGMIGGAILIFPLIVGILALQKLNTSTKKDDLTTMAILTLLFCSLLGGVFMLCLKDEDLIEGSNVRTEVKSNSANGVDPYKELERLTELYNEGVLSEEVYNEKKEKYLNMI